jgi:hypothetical protein
VVLDAAASGTHDPYPLLAGVVDNEPPAAGPARTSRQKMTQNKPSALADMFSGLLFVLELFGIGKLAAQRQRLK